MKTTVPCTIPVQHWDPRLGKNRKLQNHKTKMNKQHDKGGEETAERVSSSSRKRREKKKSEESETQHSALISSQPECSRNAGCSRGEKREREVARPKTSL